MPDRGALLKPKFGTAGGSAPMASVPDSVPLPIPSMPSSRQAVITNIAVVPGVSAPTVEITSNEPLNPKVMRLDGPPRLVLDFTNATLAGKPRNIVVENGGVKAVRMGRFQIEPPVTRLVIDLSEARDFEITHSGAKLVVKLRPAGRTSIEADESSARAMNNAGRGDVGEPPEPALEPVAARLIAPAPVVPVAAPTVAEAAPVMPELVADGHENVQENVQEDVVRQPVALLADGAISPLPASPEPAKVEAAKVEATPAPAAIVVEEPDSAVAAEPLSPQPQVLAKVEAEQPAIAEATTPATPEMKPVLLAKMEPQEPNQAPAGTSLPPAAPMVPTANAPAPRASVPEPQPAAPASAPSAPATPSAAPVPTPQALPHQPAVNFAAEQRRGVNEEVAPASPYTGEPISVNLKDVDLKDFFRLIHEISGLNIVLDPSVGGSLTMVLDDVPWDQALQIVLKNNNLDSELQGNVLRVATIDTLRKEAESRQKQTEAQALAVPKVTATRFLSYAHAKDVMPLLKRMLSVRGEIVADERTNALIVSDIPSIIPRIDILIAQLDRKTQEVEIEARVIAATRTFIRDIGTQVGFGFGNSATAVGGSVANSPTQVGYSSAPAYITSPLVTGSSATTAASIPLFSNLGALNPTSGLSLLNLGRNYRLDMILTAAESRGLLKVLSRPRVITQNNVQAVVKQGQRIPITTIGQLGGPPTTTYVDAVLRLTVTPQITAERSIFLNVDIENTQADLSSQVNGNPVFNTQQSTTQVLVTDGGTVVIGGVVQTQNTINVQQVPILGNVPGLGNLFKRRLTNTSTQELIFFITPKIIET